MVAYSRSRQSGVCAPIKPCMTAGADWMVRVSEEKQRELRYKRQREPRERGVDVQWNCPVHVPRFMTRV